MMIDAIDHLHLMVPDLRKTQILFSDLVGGDFVGPYGGDAWNANAVWYTVGGMEIFEPIDLAKPILGGQSSTRRGVIGIAFRVGDLEAAMPTAESLGLRVHSRFGSEDSGFGKFILQAQFEPSQTYRTIVELAQRQRPDDPLYSAFGKVLEHVELLVHDVGPAVSLFSALTGHPFSPPRQDAKRAALSTINGLGLRITQPLAEESPVARQLAANGEGFGTLAFIVPDLESAIARAQADGLRLSDVSQRRAEFVYSDFLGFVLTLAER